MPNPLSSLISEVQSCTHCEQHLALGPRPVLQIHPTAKILIAGQAPGSKVHKTGVPFDDPSGERLRAWLNISRETFYDPEKIAILPMGFCYPGKGKSGDLPPRPECAELWRQRILKELGNVELTLLIGKYAQDWHLDVPKKTTLTELVKNWRSFGPEAIPLPHPSPRNNIWLKKNEWFERDVVPELQTRVANLLQDFEM
ncbi:MAG: uracil-DNA glycosylase family protein [Verrucomicrobiales bacterium]